MKSKNVKRHRRSDFFWGLMIYAALEAVAIAAFVIILLMKQ